MRKVNILGVLIDNVSKIEAIEEIDRLIKNRLPCYAVTPNVDHVVRFQKDEFMKKVYKDASFVLADGMPILWASRFLGSPLKEKVSGSDIFWDICKLAADRKYRVFFLGGRKGAAKQACKAVSGRYKDLQIAGIYSPNYGFENDKQEIRNIIDMVKGSNADILLVGLGSPKQEKFIHEYKNEYNVPFSIGIGITFEYASDIVKRAPLWMQKIGLEWLFRLIKEPSRLWKRYLIDDVKFFWYLLVAKFKRK